MWRIFILSRPTFLVRGAVAGASGSVLGVLLASVMGELFTRFVRGSDGLPLFDLSLPPALARTRT